MAIMNKAYQEYYRMWDDMAEKLWANPSRIDYDADYWYNKNRNGIVREMIVDRWTGLKVLACGTGVGSAQWSDNEVLNDLGAEVTKTNLVSGEGIQVACDVCYLPFKDESFDAVFCREVIEHVIDDASLMWEVSRVLKPRGWLMITTPNGFNCMPDGKNHLRAYSPENLIGMVKHYRFEIIEKRGNVPNIMRSLLLLTQDGNKEALEEFKKLAELWKQVEESYYFGGELYLLCRKGE